MKKIWILAVTAVMVFALLPNQPVAADVAPPAKPPGSSISPGQETKVRMVSENVLMALKAGDKNTYTIEVSADFDMKNMGVSDETMDVRFPMEHISGMGDGYFGNPKIKNFKVSVDKKTLASQVVNEAYSEKSFAPIDWAEFNVTFPAGKRVLIHVSYTTDLQEDSKPMMEYIIGTGAGWYGTIGSVAITMRLPYAASESNLAYGLSEGAVIVGKEIRWHWTDYEPQAYETVNQNIVHPTLWQEILSLESQTGADPDDVDGVVALSKAYQQAGSEKHGCMDNMDAAALAEIAIQQALPLHPEDLRLHQQLAEVYYWPYACFSKVDTQSETYQKLQNELGVLMALDPGNQTAVDITKKIQDAKGAGN